MFARVMCRSWFSGEPISEKDMMSETIVGRHFCDMPAQKEERMNAQDALRFYEKEFPIVTTAGFVQQRAIRWIRENIKVGSTIFEFGCNVGANLAELQHVYEVSGSDISPRAVRAKKVQHVKLGGTEVLETYSDNAFDLVFTCSVLCHIPANVEREVVRIGKKALLVETQEKSDINYWGHEYTGKVVFEIEAPRGIIYKGYYYE